MIEPSLTALKLLIWLSARQGVKGFLFIPLCIRASCTLLSKKHNKNGSSAYRFISQKSAEVTDFYFHFCLFFNVQKKSCVYAPFTQVIGILLSLPRL